jgi:hypothetical protein
MLKIFSSLFTLILSSPNGLVGHPPTLSSPNGPQYVIAITLFVIPAEAGIQGFVTCHPRMGLSGIHVPF